MCQLKNCRYIEYYELDDYGSKVYIHFDDHYNPLWIEYVKNGESLGHFYPKK
jgi:hypothetical protein